MNQPETDADTEAPAPRFSLVGGGLFNGLLGRAGLLGPDQLPSVRCALLLALLAWLVPGACAIVQSIVTPSLRGERLFRRQLDAGALLHRRRDDAVYGTPRGRAYAADGQGVSEERATPARQPPQIRRAGAIGGLLVHRAGGGSDTADPGLARCEPRAGSYDSARSRRLGGCFAGIKRAPAVMGGTGGPALFHAAVLLPHAALALAPGHLEQAAVSPLQATAAVAAACTRTVAGG